jgi:hypothetical protein
MIAYMLTLLKTTNQILTAGIAITAFSLLLYTLTFNLRDRVARSFMLVMGCVVIVFIAEAFGSITNPNQASELEFWFGIQWVGIIFLPPTYFHFSDALLATTGRPSQWRRRWLIRLLYLVSVFFFFTLIFSFLVGALITDQAPAPYLKPTILTSIFLVFYFGVTVLAWYNFQRAYRRTTTSTSRRRMIYLIVGAIATAVGSFPYLLFGAGFAARHSLTFWIVAIISNLAEGTLIVIMAYGVAFFGVSWADRTVKSRLFRYIMRGPVTANITLALVTVIRRVGEYFGTAYSALVPIVMVGTILLMEYLITLFSPIWEKWLFFGTDRKDLESLRALENQLLTKNDLRQFLEMVSAAVCDRLQANGAYIASLLADDLELIVRVGKNHLDKPAFPEDIQQIIQNHDSPDMFQWGEDYIIPLMLELENGEKPNLIGLLGITGLPSINFDDEQKRALILLTKRATLALKDYHDQQEIFNSLQLLSPQVNLIQRMRAASRFNDSSLLDSSSMGNGSEQLPEDIVQWVKDALGHYWGGPRLTKSPLIQFKVVQEKAKDNDGNAANALREILREAIDKTRPVGERRLTGEWLLYNILEMKFMEGRKVREVALRLAVSEADLYRKQRVAIEAVAKTIIEMESQAQENTQ